MTINKTLTLMEIFFAAFCNEDGDTTIPECKGCPDNVYGKGCVHPANPMNKEGN